MLQYVPKLQCISIVNTLVNLLVFLGTQEKQDNGYLVFLGDDSIADSDFTLSEKKSLAC